MTTDIIEETKNKLKEYAEELGLSQDAIDTGYSILEDYKKKGDQDFNPEGFAAGTVYLSTMLVGEKKTQKDIGKVAKITPIEVSRNYKKIRENVDLDIVI